MRKMWKILFVFAAVAATAEASVHVEVDFSDATFDVKKLPRFWTNTGFAPPDPLVKVADYLETDDVHMNLEIIGSLPNNGLRHVRIHWLLNLLSISKYSTINGQPLPVFNFTRLDNFISRLIDDYHLYPTIEFMTTLKAKKINGLVWEDLAYQLVSRYIGRYGVKNVKKWRFETWNEPDLRGYNRLNFTTKEYNDYVRGIKDGIEAAERQFNLTDEIKLRGPAGLFKDEAKHQLCWGVLESCNEEPEECPIDVITYHRKGNGLVAEEILNGSLDLLETISQKFPNLTTFRISNTEADPVKKWSEPRGFQADVRYASGLVETVFQHWQAIYDGRMENLESISHDNSFLNFNPHFFTQRTLLARFQMNTSIPKHSQFVQKPVYSALGLLSNLAPMAGDINVIKEQSLSYVVTTNDRSEQYYACVMITSHVNFEQFTNKSKTFEFSIQNIYQNDSVGDLFYFVEGIDSKRANPWVVHQRFGGPAFPDVNVLAKLRHAHNPIVLSHTGKVVDGEIIVNLRLMEPFILQVRICSKNVPAPKRIKDLRITRVNFLELIIFWKDSFYPERCIKTYEIFFQYYGTNSTYQQIETKYIPFMYYQLRHTIPGCFKVRSRDIFDRVGKFSDEACFDGA